MKCFILAVLLCTLLSGCAHSPEPLPEKSLEEHQCRSGCLGIHRMSSEEIQAWENPSEWSEEELKERINWTKKSGGLRECRQVYRYYLGKKEYEKAKHWLNETRKKCEALPCEEMKKRLIASIDGWLASLEKTISFYKMSEEEVLEKYLQPAESGDWRSADRLYGYYKHHDQFDQAAYWLGEARELMAQRARTEEEREKVLKMYDGLQSRLSEKAELSRAGGE